MSLVHADPIALTASAPLGAKACLGSAGAVQEGYRPRLENGKYGTCVVTGCDDSHDLVQSKCRPLQKAYFDVPSKVIVMAPGEIKTIQIKTLKPVSSGSIGISSGGSADITVDGSASFENESSKSITITAGNLTEEDFLNINMVNATGKIAIKGNQSLTVKVIPQGLPKLTSIALDKASPTTADSNVTLNLSFSKSFSQNASTKLNFQVSGQKSLIQGSPKTVTVVVSKGQKTASISLPLSGETSNSPVRLTLNAQAQGRLDLNGQNPYQEFSVAPAGSNSPQGAIPALSGVDVLVRYSRVDFAPSLNVKFLSKTNSDQSVSFSRTLAQGLFLPSPVPSVQAGNFIYTLGMVLDSQFQANLAMFRYPVSASGDIQPDVLILESAIAQPPIVGLFEDNQKIYAAVQDGSVLPALFIVDEASFSSQKIVLDENGGTAYSLSVKNGQAYVGGVASSTSSYTMPDQSTLDIYPGVYWQVDLATAQVTRVMPTNGDGNPAFEAILGLGVGSQGQMLLSGYGIRLLDQGNGNFYPYEGRVAFNGMQEITYPSDAGYNTLQAGLDVIAGDDIYAPGNDGRVFKNGSVLYEGLGNQFSSMSVIGDDLYIIKTDSQGMLQIVKNGQNEGTSILYSDNGWSVNNLALRAKAP